MTLDGVAFTDNTATTGAAVYLYRAASADPLTFSATGCVCAGNEAASSVGAVFLFKYTRSAGSVLY